MNLITSKSKNKRKHSSSSDDDNSPKLQKRSTGLSSVLSDFQLSDSHNISSEAKNMSNDSVFFKSPTTNMAISGSDIQEKMSINNSLSNVVNQRRLHSSLIEEKKKNVNFHFDNYSSVGHDEVSNISLRGLSDCSSISSHAPFLRSGRFGASSEQNNLLLCTPDNNKQKQNLQFVSSLSYSHPIQN